MGDNSYEIKELKTRVRKLEAMLAAVVAIATGPITCAESDWAGGVETKDADTLAARQAALLAAHDVAPSYGPPGPTERTTIADIVDSIAEVLADPRRYKHDGPERAAARVAAKNLVDRAFGLTSLEVAKLAPAAMKAAIDSRKAETAKKAAKKKAAKTRKPRGGQRPEVMTDAAGTSTPAAPPAKRGPGRPRKADTPATPATSSTAIPTDAAPPAKRGPGRPRKTPAPEVAT